jgi:hypothetical protein
MMETKVCNLGPLQLNSGTDTVLLNNWTKVGDLIVSRISWFYSIHFFFIFLAEVSGPRNWHCTLINGDVSIASSFSSMALNAFVTWFLVTGEICPFLFLYIYLLLFILFWANKPNIKKTSQ